MLPVNSNPCAVTWRPGVFKLALYDYDGEQPGDLSFRSGDVIEMVEAKGPNWIFGRLKNGKTGLVPLTYIR
jgi:hypothetical protein